MAELELTVSQAAFLPFSSMPDSHRGLTWLATCYHDLKAQAKASKAGVCLSEERGPRLLPFPFIWKIQH